MGEKRKEQNMERVGGRRRESFVLLLAHTLPVKEATPRNTLGSNSPE